MKTVRVVAAIIEKEDKILIAQRLKGEFKGLWEFPGGKIEEQEKPEEALIREIKEEMEVDIKINKYLCTIEHDYSTFHLSMDCFVCTLTSEGLHLNDHSAIKLIIPFEDKIDWVPADVKVIENYRKAN